jgi:hypothetical protein
MAAAVAMQGGSSDNRGFDKVPGMDSGKYVCYTPEAATAARVSYTLQHWAEADQGLVPEPKVTKSNKSQPTSSALKIESITKYVIWESKKCIDEKTFWKIILLCISTNNHLLHTHDN